MTKRNNSEPQTAAPSLESSLNQSKGKGAPLPGDTRSFMENRFGTDFSNVRVHNDNSSAELNKQLNSQAFTAGNNIYFNQGKYNPDTSNGKKLLAHELVHVQQQNQRQFSKIQKQTTKKKPEKGAATFLFSKRYTHADELNHLATQIITIGVKEAQREKNQCKKEGI